MESYGNRLRQLRKENNKALREIGETLNYSFSNIAMLERCERKYTQDLLIDIAKLFNVSTDYLLCLTDNRNEDSSDSLYNEIKSLSKQQKNEIKQYIKFVKARDKS